MAKAKAQTTQRPRGRSAQRIDSERWNRYLIIGGVVAVILVAFGVIAYGWYQTRIAPLGRTVLRVGEIEFSLGHLERRMELELSRSGSAYAGEAIRTLPGNVLNNLREEALLLSGAEQLAVSVSDEDIDAKVREGGGLGPEASASEVAKAFRTQVENTGLHSGEYRQMLAAEVLRERILNYFIFLAPPSEPQVRARWIIVQTREEADDVVARLAAGEDFVQVAADVSLTTAPAASEGTEWNVRGAFQNEDIDGFLFEDAEPDGPAQVIETNSFVYVMQLLEREADRNLDDSQRRVVASREMSAWLKALEDEIEVVEDLSPEDEIRAINDVI
jgi:hypothetical protein